MHGDSNDPNIFQPLKSVLFFPCLVYVACALISGPIEKASKNGLIGYLIVISIMLLWILFNLLGAYLSIKNKSIDRFFLKVSILSFLLFTYIFGYTVLYAILKLNTL
jgi:hypothetical protein